MVSDAAGAHAAQPLDVADGSRSVVRRPRFTCFEGLRALAASMVVVHHAASLVGAGRAGPLDTPAAVMDMGVAIFFVISGFLIYRPFAAAHLDGGSPQRTRTFLWRRLLRIGPPYWAALTILWATGSFHLGPQWWRYYLFLQIYDAFTTLGGIVPAWSLNTEIVFYLFIPVWSAFVGRVLGRGRRASPALELAGTLALFAAGYLSRAVISSTDRVWVNLPGHAPVTMREVSFSWFPNNVDLFALGMTVAVLSAWAAQDPVVRARIERVVGRGTAWWAAAAALFVWFAYRVGPPQFNGGYRGFYWQQRQATFGLIAVCLLLPVVFGDQHEGWLRRVLQWPPVVWLGIVSYGIYLWHQDLLERIPGWLDRAPTEVPVLVAVVGAFALGTAAAAASWYALEQPTQRRFKHVL